MAEPAVDPPREPRDRHSEALAWARSQLSADGMRRLLAGIARLLRAGRPFGLVIALVGAGGIVSGLLLLSSERTIAIVVIVLSVPAAVAPLLARARLDRLATALEHPEEVIVQARDLANELRAGPELRSLFDRDGSRDGRPRTRRSAARGRMGRAARTVRSVSAVVGAARPDPDRHPLLVPFTPSRLRGLWMLLGWSLLGLMLAGFAITLAAITALLTAL